MENGIRIRYNRTRVAHCHHGALLGVHADAGGDPRDEGHEAARLGTRGGGRGGEGPDEKVLGVIEPEHAHVILDIVLVEEVVDLRALVRVGDVHLGPCEAVGHVAGLRAEVRGIPVRDDGPVPSGIRGGAVCEGRRGAGGGLGLLALLVFRLRDEHGLRAARELRECIGRVQM